MLVEGVSRPQYYLDISCSLIFNGLGTPRGERAGLLDHQSALVYGLGVTVGVAGIDITTSMVLGKMDSTSTLLTSTSTLGIS